MLNVWYYKLKEKIFRYGEKWDALAPCESEAIVFAHKNINKEPKKGSPPYSVEYKLAMSAETINESLRSGKKDFDDFSKELQSKYSLKEDIVVYRGVSEIPYTKMKKAAESIRGIDFLERGFLNTSIVKGKQINYDCQLRIFLPKGTCSFYVGNITSEEKIYYEVIVQKGAKLKILSMDKNFINCKLIATD
jgi:hypothetical protein